MTKNSSRPAQTDEVRPNVLQPESKNAATKSDAATDHEPILLKKLHDLNDEAEFIELNDESENEVEVKASNANLDRINPQKTIKPAYSPNKMGVMSEGKLLLSMSLPAMISMFVLALYTIVDSIFIAHANEEALTAISITYPIGMFRIALSVGIASGVNVLAARFLGKKDFDKAGKIAANGFILTFIASLFLVAFAIYGVEPYVAGETGNALIYQYGVTYLRITCLGSPALFIGIMGEKILQAEGRTMLTMITQLFGAILNTIFDPILIFGFGKIPAMGIAGAAYATVGSQVLTTLLILIFNHHYNQEIHIRIHTIKLNLFVVRKIIKQALPFIIMGSIASVMSFGMNKILLQFSTTAVAVLGIYLRIQSFVIMPVLGLNVAATPIFAYNYGAKNRSRIIRTLKFSWLYAFIITFIGMMFMQLTTQQLINMFNPSDLLSAIGIKALRIISYGFCLAGLSIATAGFFNGLGQGKLSMITSITRQLVILLPLAYLLAQANDINLIWWAFPLAEIINIILIAVLFYRVYHRHLDAIK